MLKAETMGWSTAPWSDDMGMRPTGPGDSSMRGECPLDLIHLAKQTFGDRRLETELLRLFVRQAQQAACLLDDIRPDRASGQGDADLLHLLAGSSRAVGATRVAVLATDGEALLRRNDAMARLDAPRRAALHREIATVSRFISELIDQG